MNSAHKNRKSMQIGAKYMPNIDSNDKPLVSIIVPVYKTEQYLNACIESLVNQTYQNIEIILVDDGSPDRCPKICDSWKKRDCRIVVIHSQNCGVSHARNLGLSKATGKYIAFCDSDDYYTSDHISKMLELATIYLADIVICGYYILVGDKVTCSDVSDSSGWITKEEVFKNVFLTNKIGGYTCNKLFSKDCISNIAFRDELQICEDTCFLLEAMAIAKNIYYTCEPLYYYRQLSASATGNVNNICSENYRSKYTELYECILNEFDLNKRIRRYIKSDIFKTSVCVKCEYKARGGNDHRFINALNEDIRKYYKVFFSCSEISLREKAKVLANLLFNAREVKKTIRKIIDKYKFLWHQNSI